MSSLAAGMTSWIARSRATGSATSVHSEVKMFDTRLPVRRRGAPAASVDDRHLGNQRARRQLAARREITAQRAGDEGEEARR